MIPMLFGITVITYLAIFFLPGGPTAGIMGDLNPKVSPEIRERLIKQYQLDKPFYIQYGNWVQGLCQLDFGRSFKDNRPVVDIIGERLPRTILLSGLSMLFAFVFAIPIGIISAVNKNKWGDRLLTVFVFVGFSVPTYWVALLAIIVFGIYLGWVPITGYQSLLADEMNFPSRMIDIAHHLILPVLVSGLTSLAGLSRYVRNGMLEVIRQDYVRTARAKGLPEKQVIYSHALKNTLIPVITIVGLSIPSLISAGVIFETIFSYPGLGRLVWEAVVSRNVPVLMASVTLGALLTLVGNLVADILYAYADPRIRYR